MSPPLADVRLSNTRNAPDSSRRAARNIHPTSAEATTLPGSLSDAVSYYNTGEALLQQSCVQQAIYNHQQALAIRQENHEPELEADSHFQLGFALEISGNLRDALVHCQQALEKQRQLNPSCTKTVKFMIQVATLFEK
mmetsp:Transcript_112/g.233  ORF Transcript_112/g.233 Transcript_112/m.233 type:complete len:138 (+) Transcript_112:160-573(+)